MKKVISFSLYGKKDFYIKGAIKNLEESALIYPEWEQWFYCSTSITSKTHRIEELGGKIIDVGDVDRFNCMCMLYRYFPTFDDNVDVCIFRDTDSVINLKEQSAVNEWLNSDFIAHSMHDNRSHDARIMGGMWGIKSYKINKNEYRKIFTDVINKIKTDGNSKPKGYDQKFLEESIYPLIKGSLMVHGFYGHGKRRKEFSPFPYKGKIKYGSFVGEPVI